MALITAATLMVGTPLVKPAPANSVIPTPGAVNVDKRGKANPVQMASYPPRRGGAGLVPEHPQTGAEIKQVGKQQPNPIQMHGIYSNNPGFLEAFSKAPWESPYYKAQPPANTPVQPAKVNVQLKEGKLPYGSLPKQMRWDSASAFLPSPAPANPSFGTIL